MKNTIRITVIAAIQLFCLPSFSASTNEIEITLKKKPVLTEEGIHISTDKGDHAMYAVHASPRVYAAFNAAKKGQCLLLNTESEFSFTDASQIKSIKSCKSTQQK
jgi:hypothetical protein